MGSLPSKGPNSPWSVGTRTLLARTCVRCHRLGDADSFPPTGPPGVRRKVCHDCQNRQKKRDREQRGIGLPPGTRPPEELQTAKRRQWAREDDQYIRDNLDHLTFEQLAVALGRSVRAVYKRREVLGIEPVRVRHRVAPPPWQIRGQDGR